MMKKLQMLSIALLLFGISTEYVQAMEGKTGPEAPKESSTPPFNKQQVDAYRQSQAAKAREAMNPTNQQTAKVMNDLFFQENKPQSLEILDTINMSKPEDIHTNLTNLLITSNNPQVAHELSNLRPSTKNNNVRDFAWEIKESNDKNKSSQQSDALNQQSKGINLGEKEISTDDIQKLKQRRSTQKATNKNSQDFQNTQPINIDMQIQQSLQSAYKKMNMESPEIQSIIDNSKNFNEINQQFTQLLMTTQDPTIYKNIEAITNLLDSNFNSQNSTVHELYLLAHERNFNVQNIMNNPKYATLYQKAEALKQKLSEVTDKFDDATERISQNYKDNVTQLYTDAIKLLNTQSLIEIIHNSDIHQILLDPSLTHQEKLDKLDSGLATAEYLAKDADTRATSKNLPSLYNDAITQLNNKPRTAILRDNIQATIRSSLNSLATLANRGALNAKSVASKIKSLFVSSKTKASPDQKEAVINKAVETMPSKNASPEEIENWVKNTGDNILETISEQPAAAQVKNKQTRWPKSISEAIFGKPLIDQTTTATSPAEDAYRERVETASRV